MEKEETKGLMKLIEENGSIVLKDQCTITEEKEGLFQTVFKDGALVIEETLSMIRKRI